MSLPLLSTKFNLPTPGNKFVNRPRLVQRLNEAVDAQSSLILVCGPAGYGKTSLVAEWVHGSKKFQPGQVAWLALDNEDNDLTRFLTYVVAALQRNHPGFGSGLINLLRSHKISPYPALATMLINELDGFSNPQFLILDDYHLIDSESIQNFMAFLIDHQPPMLRLVLITRTDPNLPLARMRAKGQLVEVRQAELCFLPEEVQQFTSRVMDLDLSGEQLVLLVKQTEGWISGLQLAAVSMRNIQDRSAFLEKFSGDHEFIADYLTEEVLTRLPLPVRDFLLQTSVLERLSADLCQVITQSTDTQKTLNYLLDSNLFIMPLDNQHKWFRYHPLFADLLRKRLLAQQDFSPKKIHLRASLWFREEGLLDLAITHAIAGEEYDLAATMIGQIAEKYLMVGQATTLLRWLEALPEDLILAQPILGSLKGFSLILCNRSIKEAMTLIAKMDAAGSLAEFHGEMVTLRALLLIMQGKSDEAIQLSGQALQQLPLERVFFRSLAADSLGMAYTLAGDFEAARVAFEQVVEISTQSDNVMMTLMALTNQAGLLYMQGKLRAGIRICQQVLDLAGQRIGRQTPITGKTLLNLGEMVREQGNLELADKYLSEGARLMDDFTEIGLPMAYLSLAKLKMSSKDWESAQHYIDLARQRASETHSTKMDDQLVEVAQARLWIARGQLEQAAGWAQDRGFMDQSPLQSITSLDRRSGVGQLEQVELMTLARLYLAKGHPGNALELLEALYFSNEARGIKRRQLECLVLKTLALKQMGQTEQALDCLSEALQLGQPEGFQIVFVEEGQPMLELLYLAVTRKIYPDYSKKLLKVLSQEDWVEKNPGELDDLIEPLSARELEIISLIAEGLSNKEIATALFISISTVKGHTSNIFGKLSVKNRTEAVSRGRRMGLIPRNDPG